MKSPDIFLTIVFAVFANSAIATPVAVVYRRDNGRAAQVIQVGETVPQVHSSANGTVEITRNAESNLEPEIADTAIKPVVENTDETNDDDGESIKRFVEVKDVVISAYGNEQKKAATDSYVKPKYQQRHKSEELMDPTKILASNYGANLFDILQKLNEAQMIDINNVGGDIEEEYGELRIDESGSLDFGKTRFEPDPDPEPEKSPVNGNAQKVLEIKLESNGDIEIDPNLEKLQTKEDQDKLLEDLVEVFTPVENTSKEKVGDHNIVNSDAKVKDESSDIDVGLIPLPLLTELKEQKESIADNLGVDLLEIVKKFDGGQIAPTNIHDSVQVNYSEIQTQQDDSNTYNIIPLPIYDEAKTKEKYNRKDQAKNLLEIVQKIHGVQPNVIDSYGNKVNINYGEIHTPQYNINSIHNAGKEDADVFIKPNENSNDVNPGFNPIIKLANKETKKVVTDDYGANLLTILKKMNENYLKAIGDYGDNIHAKYNEEKIQSPTTGDEFSETKIDYHGDIQLDKNNKYGIKLQPILNQIREQEKQIASNYGTNLLDVLNKNDNEIVPVLNSNDPTGHLKVELQEGGGIQSYSEKVGENVSWSSDSGKPDTEQINKKVKYAVPDTNENHSENIGVSEHTEQEGKKSETLPITPDKVESNDDKTETKELEEEEEFDVGEYLHSLLGELRGYTDDFYKNFDKGYTQDLAHDYNNKLKSNFNDDNLKTFFDRYTYTDDDSSEEDSDKKGENHKAELKDRKKGKKKRRKNFYFVNEQKEGYDNEWNRDEFKKDDDFYNDADKHGYSNTALHEKKSEDKETGGSDGDVQSRTVDHEDEYGSSKKYKDDEINEDDDDSYSSKNGKETKHKSEKEYKNKTGRDRSKDYGYEREDEKK